jgi:hypothetical protein
VIAELTLITSRVIGGGGESSQIAELVHVVDDLEGPPAKVPVEHDALSSTVPLVPHVAHVNSVTGHFLETHGLSAELDIRSVAMARADLELHRNRCPTRGNLDHVCTPGETQAGAPQRNGTQHETTAFRPARATVGTTVAALATDRVLAVDPDIVDKDQRALPRAVAVVLEGRQWDRVAVHGWTRREA